MKRLVITGIIAIGVLFLGVVGANTNKQNSTQTDSAAPAAVVVPKKVIPTCDGTTVTTTCTLDGATYKTYLYHPAVVEKSHTETVTTYQEEVTGYCTLCNDGSRSPSCATGSGTCSHHGGVAQWNAPITSNVPVNSAKTVVDAAAQDAYYEKVVE
jgi:hypothetical protein